MNIEDVENIAAEKYLFGDAEINFEAAKENQEIIEKYKLIGETLDNYCGLFYNKRDYSKKIEKAVSNIKMKMERTELIFCEVKLLGNYVKRIPEIADFIAQTNQTIYKYAAATEYIKLVTSEKFKVGNYEITLKVINNEFIINLKKDLEKISGDIGFVVKNKLKERKFCFNIVNGEYRIKLRKDEEVIKNDDAVVFLFLE